MPGELRFVQVEKPVEAARTRPKHRKARTGCESCKLRKVKCDERLPRCSACRKRDQSCIRAHSNESSVTINAVSQASLPDPTSSGLPIQNNESSAAPDAVWQEPSPDPAGCTLDLIAIKLFYVFQQRTANTLCLGGRLWQDLLPLAFRERYFMHAILSLAAAHEQATGQDESSVMNQTTLHHQVEAIRSLRAISEGVTQSNQDAIIATALLLYHHTWAKADQDNEIFPYRSLLPLAAMPYKEVMLGTVFKGPSVWHPTVMYSPKMALQAFYVHTSLAEELEHFFQDQFWLICPGSGTRDERFGTFMGQSRRLVPVVAVILLCNSGAVKNSEWIMDSVARYLGTWPLLCSSEFNELEKAGDPVAYAILWQYFMAIDRCGISSMWWARERTTYALRHAQSELHKLGFEISSVFEAFENSRIAVVMGSTLGVVHDVDERDMHAGH